MYPLKISQARRHCSGSSHLFLKHNLSQVWCSSTTVTLSTIVTNFCRLFLLSVCMGWSSGTPARRGSLAHKTIPQSVNSVVNLRLHREQYGQIGCRPLIVARSASKKFFTNKSAWLTERAAAAAMSRRMQKSEEFYPTRNSSLKSRFRTLLVPALIRLRRG